MSFINISNHPSGKWSEEQKNAAKQMGYDTPNTFEYGDKVRVNDGICGGMVGIVKPYIYTNLDRYIEVQDIDSETHWVSIPVEAKHILTVLESVY